MLYHVPVDVPPWGPCDALARVERAYRRSGSTPLRVDVGAYELLADGDHFTREAYRAFCDDLVACLPHGSALVVSDSTVGHHDHDEAWEYTGWGSRYLASRRADRTVVDSVCGSGFVAGEFYHARLAARRRRGERYDHVVVVGGWNDVRDARAHLTDAAMDRALAVAAKLMDTEAHE